MNTKLAKSLLLPEAYNKRLLQRDIIAGITVLVMLVPQSMAYAMLAGLPPVMGLYASTIPLLIYALLGASRYLAVGPVAMASILVFAGVSVLAEPGSPQYIELVILLTLMAGLIQLLLSLLNAGAFIKFVSKHVISGFTSAVAIIIALSQVGSLLGMELSSQNQVIFLLGDIFRNLTKIHLLTAVIGVGAFFFLRFAGKISTRLPWPLITVLLGVIVVYTLQLEGRGVSIVGDVPAGLPQFGFPEVSFSAVQLLFPAALTIALIAMMESLAITKTLAGDSGERVNINKELKAIGAANAIGSFLQSYVVTGSFSRSAVNFHAGAVSKISTVVTALGIVLTLFFFTPLFYYLPQAVLAAIIMSAVFGLIDFRAMRKSFQIKAADGWVWCLTFAATLLIGIQWGLLIGVLVSLCILIHQISHPKVVELGWHGPSRTYRDIQRYEQANKPRTMLLLRIDTRIHFSNAESLEDQITGALKRDMEASDRLKDCILDMGSVNDIDTVGVEMIERIMTRYHGNVNVWLVNLKGPVRDVLKKSLIAEKYAEQISFLSLEKIVEKRKPTIEYLI
ncbi:sodium-independent anion transporter [Salipaludibacillus keqinensis]|uniref:Sodium-independent anion transporter n=1 Tax=Salipaludibacillus keqinensis TaxID=2045207 RepID=A0A323TZ60_9BACI|nr:sulfate permease [Salipaludibacillus keqinensis]PYZ94875.1 sodium-independent anion transporter [Salipaludibacillus keqinensis]